MPAWPNADMGTAGCISELRRYPETALVLDFDVDLGRHPEQRPGLCRAAAGREGLDRRPQRSYRAERRQQPRCHGGLGRS